VQGVRFSVVITCYNQRDFIRAAVDSALAQRHALKEVIVVDDGSTDGSRELLEQYAGSIELVRFPTNRGAIEARNDGAARAKGEYLVFLDGDDLFTPWALDVYETIVAERSPKIIFGSLRWFEGAIPILKNDDMPSEIEFVDYTNLMMKDRPFGLSASVFVVDRHAFQDVAGWSSGIFHLDLVDIALKLGYSGHTVLICSPFTALYRLHTANSILTIPLFLRNAHRLMDKENAGEYPGGRKHRFERYAWLGGVILFWTKRALRAGLNREALRLVASGSTIVLAAIVCRSIAWIRGRRPVESLELSSA